MKYHKTSNITNSLDYILYKRGSNLILYIIYKAHTHTHTHEQRKGEWKCNKWLKWRIWDLQWLKSEATESFGTTHTFIYTYIYLYIFQYTPDEYGKNCPINLLFAHACSSSSHSSLDPPHYLLPTRYTFPFFYFYTF